MTDRDSVQFGHNHQQLHLLLLFSQLIDSFYPIHMDNGLLE